MNRTVVLPHIKQRRRLRARKLRELGYADYSAYLRSPHWQTVKTRFRASDQPQACMCGEPDGLDLHHKTYERIGAEELTDLVLLCSCCHSMVHALDGDGSMGINLAGFESRDRAARYAAEQEPRTVAARAEYFDSHSKCHARELGARLRTAVMSGALTGAQIAEIDRLLSRVEARNGAAP